jgi:outer membrane lipoprotein carrier protein
VCLPVLLVVGLAAHAGEQSKPDAGALAGLDDLHGGEKVHALIDRVVEAQQAMRSLEADFRQLKVSALLLEPASSHGRFTYLAPDMVRWDYVGPDPMVVVFNDDLLTTFHPQRSQAERVKISRRQRRFVRVLAGTQPLDELTNQFSIQLTDPGAPSRYLLTLRPTNRVLKRKLSSVILEVDREMLLPVVVEYNEADGDSTRYEFSNLDVNGGVEPSMFQLELDGSIEVEEVDASVGG